MHGQKNTKILLKFRFEGKTQQTSLFGPVQVSADLDHEHISKS